MENRLIFARIATSKVTTQVVDGRSYLVAPVVAIKAGVLNFKLVPAAEIEKSWKSWNDVPIPINHPLRNGEKISARTISMIEKVVIGRFYNAYYEDEKLKGELWIDVKKAKKVGGDAIKMLKKLQKGEPVEVSTAYFADESDETGTYNGVEYEGIQYNLRPDHLALLPTSIGACSWEDGCGAPRVNQEGETMPQLRVALKEGESYGMRQEAVEKAVKAAVIPEGSTGWYVYISDLYEDDVVFEVSEPDLDRYHLKAPYTIDDSLEATLGDIVPVKRVVSFTELESYEELVVNPYPNEHACRIRAPGNFQKGSFKRIARGTKIGHGPRDGKKLSVIIARLKGKTTTTTQAFRYPTDTWTKTQAKAHCGEEGGTFEAAAVKTQKKEGKMGAQEGFIEKVVGPLREFVRNLIEVRNMSEKEQMLETLHKNGVELEGLEDMDDGVLKWMVEHNKPIKANKGPDPDAETEKQGLIDALVSNEKCSLSKEALTALDTSVLKELSAEYQPAKVTEEERAKAKALGIAIDEYFKAQETDLETVVAHMKAQETAADKAKQDLVAALVANEKCTMTKDVLDKMETDVLRQFAAQYEPGSYLGVGVPHRDLEAIPAPPAVVLAVNKEGDDK